ncbi:MAG TPA: hypothetical protein VF002_07830 [Gaiellaceae bacterium]
MSTSPERTRADDRIVHAISRWLARHLSDHELRAELAAIDPGELAPKQAEAVRELQQELDSGAGRASLEMIARETVEAVALGG